MKISITTRSTCQGRLRSGGVDHPSDDLLRFIFDTTLAVKKRVGHKLASRIELIRITFEQPIMSSSCEARFWVIWNTPDGEKEEQEIRLGAFRSYDGNNQENICEYIVNCIKAHVEQVLIRKRGVVDKLQFLRNSIDQKEQRTS